MSTYRIVQALLQLAPWILVPVSIFAVRRWRAPLRYATVIALGWIGLFTSVMAYWNFSIGYAPDQQIAADLAARDGGPTTFALFFGWVYVSIYLTILEFARLTWQWARGRLSPPQPSTG